MKTPEEILFDKMHPDEEGKIIPLTDEQIIQSMKEYAVEVIGNIYDNPDLLK